MMMKPEKPRVLLVSGEHRMNKLLGEYLRKADYAVTETDSMDAVTEAFRTYKRMNMIVLDTTAIDMEIKAFFRELRFLSKAPVVLLVSAETTADQKRGYREIAAECIEKPFSPQVLVDCADRLVKGIVKKEKDTVLVAGPVTIDLSCRKGYLAGNDMELSRTEYALLSYFVKNEGKVLHKEQILEDVWPTPYFGTNRTVDTHVRKLRIKLGNNADMIKTIWGTGYMLMAGD